MFDRLKFILMFALALPLFADEVDPPPVISDGANLSRLQEIYRSYLNENSGLDHIEGISSIMIKGDILIGDEPARAFRLFRKRPGLMRMNVVMDDFEVETAFDGKRGWERFIRQPDEILKERELGDDEAEDMKLNSSIEGPFFNMAQRIDKLVYSGLEHVRGEMCYRIDSTETDLPFRTVWLSRENFQEVKILKNSARIKEQTIYQSDHIKRAGIWAAGRIEMWHDGVKNYEIRVDDVSINVGVYDRFFEKSGEEEQLPADE